MSMIGHNRIVTGLWTGLMLAFCAGCHYLDSAPEIKEILMSRNDSSVILTVIATDRDGDSLTYAWSCPDGSFLIVPPFSTTSNPAKMFLKYGERGTVSVTCIVSDGEKTSQKSRDITFE